MTHDTQTQAGPDPDRNLARTARLEKYIERAREGNPGMVVEGTLRRTVGLTMEAEGCHAPVGGRCDIVAMDGRRLETEVVGFAGERLFLMPADGYQYCFWDHKSHQCKRVKLP